MVPSNRKARRYGTNPYIKYDSTKNPFLYRGDYDGPGSPMSYVVSVDKDAWLLEDLQKSGTITHGNLRIEWKNGMNSALDRRRIDQSRDIGFVTVKDGNKDISYDTSFAFAFKAFHPDGIIHTLELQETNNHDRKKPH